MCGVPGLGRCSLIAAAAFALALATPAEPVPRAVGAGAPRVTMITDSVGGVLFWTPRERERLALGLDFRLETQTCRKLVSTGCFAYGQVPLSVLEVVERLGPELGRIVVIDVGYNDAAEEYGAGIDEVMRALLAAGVDRVLWVTLWEGQSTWAAINEEIRAAPARWPQLAVAEWAPVAAQEPGWLVDGPHLSQDGAAGLVELLRPLVLAACGTACAPPVATMLAARVANHRALLRWRGDERAMTFDVSVRRGSGPWLRIATRSAATSLVVGGARSVLTQARVRARSAADVAGPWSPSCPYRL